MSADNLRHWEALRHTDPNDTKPFDRGRFKGTATKPIANIRALTEHFGPCGLGWGMHKPEFTLVTADNELLVYCTVALWYMEEPGAGTLATVYGVGGDKVVRIEKNGPFISDEAYKAAYTDALGNAMKHIGVNADIHSGEFDKCGTARPTAAATQPATSATASRGPSSTGEPETLSKIRDRIHRALSQTNEKLTPDHVLKVNKADLMLIKNASETAYNNLITYATQRTTMLAERKDNAGPADYEAGSALAQKLREGLIA